MAITLGKLLPRPVQPTNVYRFFGETMIGDADGEGYLHFDVKTPEEVESMIEMLAGMKDYGEFDEKAREFASLVGWPHDPQSGNSDYQALDGYAVTFFDDNGVEREVWSDKTNLSAMKKYYIPR